MDPSFFGKRLHELRVERNLPKYMVCRWAGISCPQTRTGRYGQKIWQGGGSTLTNLELLGDMPTWSTVLGLCRALQVRPSDFLIPASTEGGQIDMRVLNRRKLFQLIQEPPPQEVCASWFGPRLRELRTDRGLTQADLASLSGLALGVVRKIEQNAGRKGPRWDTVLTLCTALACSPDDFLTKPASTEKQRRGRRSRPTLTAHQLFGPREPAPEVHTVKRPRGRPRKNPE